MKISREKLMDTVKILHTKLVNQKYAIRGTASLILQDLDMGLDDIDVLCNKETALVCNTLLSEFLVDGVEYKESPKFKSYYGRFIIDNIQVEIMGEWQIFSNKKGWSMPYSPDEKTSTSIAIDGFNIPVTRIETELEMYMFMGRWTTLQKIKRQLNSNRPEQSQLF